MASTTRSPTTRAALLAAVEPWATSRRVGTAHTRQGVQAIRRLLEYLQEGEAGGLADADPAALVTRLARGKAIAPSTRAAYLSHVRSFQKFLGGSGGSGGRAPGPILPEVVIPCGRGHVTIWGLPHPLTRDHLRQIVRGLKLWLR